MKKMQKKEKEIDKITIQEYRKENKMIILESISIVILALFVVACIGASMENGTMGGYIIAIFLIIPLITIILETFLN